VLATQTLPQSRPKWMSVTVDGSVRPGVTAKDIVLAIIGHIGTGGGIGHVIEYRGQAIRELSMEGRMTVCNMSIEAGAKAGLIAPDDTTFEYLQGRDGAPTGDAWEAAVADWRPRSIHPVKLKKREMSATLELEPNPDILLTVKPAKEGRLFVGFAAETGDPLAEAQRKLEAKGLDLMVANDVSQPGSGFAVDTNRVTLLAPGAPAERLPLMSKRDVADRILDRLQTLAETEKKRD